MSTAIYSCPVCGRKYTSRQGMRFHFRKFHPIEYDLAFKEWNKDKPCPICYKLISKAGMELHIYKVHTEVGRNQIATPKGRKATGLDRTKIQCPECSKVVATCRLKWHINKDHPSEGEGWHNSFKGHNKNTNPILKEISRKSLIQTQSPDYINPFKGKSHTDETKEILSKKRIEYNKAHPDHITGQPWSNPRPEYASEKYFRECFQNAGIQFIQEKHMKQYRLDFTFPNKLVDLECDGVQHYTEQIQMDSDHRKMEYLSTLGYITIRIHWAKFCQLNIGIPRQMYVSRLFELIFNFWDTQPLGSCSLITTTIPKKNPPK